MTPAEAPAARPRDQSITIGIKYDQPGLGQKEGDTFKGLDVDVAKYVAKELGYEGDKVVFKETPSAQRETAIQGGQVSLIFATYSITDARKEKVSFAGPYFVAGQDLLVRADNADITGPDAMNGKTLCSVTGSTPAENIKKNYAAYSEAVRAGHLQQVRGGARRRQRRRSHDRQRHPGGLCRPAAVRRASSRLSASRSRPRSTASD